METDGDAPFGLDAFELLQEISVEMRPAEFSVGNTAQPEILLIFHDGADRLVFDEARFRGSDGSRPTLFTGVR